MHVLIHVICDPLNAGTAKTYLSVYIQMLCAVQCEVMSCTAAVSVSFAREDIMCKTKY